MVFTYYDFETQDIYTIYAKDEKESANKLIEYLLFNDKMTYDELYESLQIAKCENIVIE